MLITIERYRAITGDETTNAATVSARIEEAVELLEERLDRKLESAERTERMFPTRDGSLWPHAIPVTDGGDYTVDGYRLMSFWPAPNWPSTQPGLDVVYTGGWVERSANPDAVNALPTHIERDLAWAAFALGQTAQTRQLVGVASGASSVRLGDAAITFGSGGAKARTDVIPWSRRTLSYRYVRIGGDPC